jgi:hypothetical protein
VEKAGDDLEPGGGLGDRALNVGPADAYSTEPTTAIVIAPLGVAPTPSALSSGSILDTPTRRGQESAAPTVSRPSEQREQSLPPLVAQERVATARSCWPCDWALRLQWGACKEPLLLSPEAFAYIDGSVTRSASRRLICLGDLLEALRTAHVASPL